MDPMTCAPNNPRHCSQISGGDTSIENFTPEYAFEIFLKVNHRNQRTPLTVNFFSTKNVLFITKEIARILEKRTGSEKPIHIPFNDEVAQTMIDVAQNNIGLTYVPGAVSILNRQVIEHEVTVFYNSLLRKKLWIKYYLAQDRMRVMPYGELTKETRGESIVSPSHYMLSNPWSRYQAAYLKDTEGLCRTESGEYKRIPGYLEPKVPKIGQWQKPSCDLGVGPKPFQSLLK